MFYRLTHVDGAPLPVNVDLGECGMHLVTEGGLLTEPPEPERGYEGSAKFHLDGPVDRAGRPRLVIHSSESYRWLSPGRLEIARRVNAYSRLIGKVAGEVLTLTRKPDSDAYAGRYFTLVQADHEPIPPQWQDTFDFGPGWSTTTWLVPPTPELLRMHAHREAEREAARLAEAQRRLSRAWSTPT